MLRTSERILAQATKREGEEGVRLSGSYMLELVDLLARNWGSHRLLSRFVTCIRYLCTFTFLSK